MTVFGLQINAQQSRIMKQVTAGISVALGELIDELLNAKRALSEYDLLFVPW